MFAFGPVNEMREREQNKERHRGKHREKEREGERAQIGMSHLPFKHVSFYHMNMGNAHKYVILNNI